MEYDGVTYMLILDTYIDTVYKFWQDKNESTTVKTQLDIMPACLFIWLGNIILLLLFSILFHVSNEYSETKYKSIQHRYYRVQIKCHFNDTHKYIIHVKYSYCYHAYKLKS